MLSFKTFLFLDKEVQLATVMKLNRKVLEREYLCKGSYFLSQILNHDLWTLSHFIIE